MSKLDTEIKPMKSLEAGSDEQDANTVKMTSRLKSKATRKMNHTVRRIIQLPSKYSQGLKAPVEGVQWIIIWLCSSFSAVLVTFAASVAPFSFVTLCSWGLLSSVFKFA